MAYAPHIVSLQTPVGTVIVESDATTLTAVCILAADEAVPPRDDSADSPAAIAARQLGEYFAGHREHFDVPLAPANSPRGEVLRLGIAAIPYGQRMTYGALAQALESGPRAVGQACRRNPFPIIIPCHRVTSSAGPEHYSGGNGTATKAWLLGFETRTLTAERKCLS